MSSRKERAYEVRQREAGLRKVCVWVPERDVERLKVYAERLRKAPVVSTAVHRPATAASETDPSLS
jgi:hypothetical protein